MAFFLRFSNVKKIRVLQGHYGGATPKATDLLILNGGNDPEQILVRHRTTQLPKASAIGKNADGSLEDWCAKAISAGFLFMFGVAFRTPVAQGRPRIEPAE